jgi:hypothetical protein
MTDRAFMWNTRIYTSAARAAFAAKDIHNPACRDLDWAIFVVGPPQATETMSVQELKAEGYLGLYKRLPGEPPCIITDNDPRRLSPRV